MRYVVIALKRLSCSIIAVTFCFDIPNNRHNRFLSYDRCFLGGGASSSSFGIAGGAAVAAVTTAPTSPVAAKHTGEFTASDPTAVVDGMNAKMQYITKRICCHFNRIVCFGRCLTIHDDEVNDGRTT
jgi:hypothetical protein